MKYKLKQINEKIMLGQWPNFISCADIDEIMAMCDEVEIPKGFYKVTRPDMIIDFVTYAPGEKIPRTCGKKIYIIPNNINVNVINFYKLEREKMLQNNIEVLIFAFQFDPEGSKGTCAKHGYVSK